jgi:hypothetical protein
MSFLALALAATMLLLAVLHAYWGLGGVWPGKDAKTCARTVGGFAGATRMASPSACFAVAAALVAAALISLVQGGLMEFESLGLFPSLAAGGAAFVFAGRGIAGFTPAWRRLTPEQPFAKLDTRYYSPLCLLIGTAFAILAVTDLAYGF